MVLADTFDPMVRNLSRASILSVDGNGPYAQENIWFSSGLAEFQRIPIR
jgi:hypothetical protein